MHYILHNILLLFIVPIDKPTDLSKRIIACPMCPKVVNTIFETMESLSQHCRHVHKKEYEVGEVLIIKNRSLSNNTLTNAIHSSK